jgi:hypothetical protein
MSKEYYTPTIEEFYTGFEFVLWLNNSYWSKPRVWDYKTTASLKIIEQDINNQQVKVKYLDREDIESLGFNTEDNGECYNKTNAFDIYGLYPWEWNKGIQNQYKVILNGDTLFLGIIKNKSELKVLLKQLNIHE